MKIAINGSVNNMFEKIFITSLLIALIFCAIALMLEKDHFGMFSTIYLFSHITFILGYLAVKFIGFIWGVNIDLFPSIF